VKKRPPAMAASFDHHYLFSHKLPRHPRLPDRDYSGNRFQNPSTVNHLITSAFPTITSVVNPCLGRIPRWCLPVGRSSGIIVVAASVCQATVWRFLCGIACGRFHLPAPRRSGLPVFESKLAKPVAISGLRRGRELTRRCRALEFDEERKQSLC